MGILPRERISPRDYKGFLHGAVSGSKPLKWTHEREPVRVIQTPVQVRVQVIDLKKWLR